MHKHWTAVLGLSLLLAACGQSTPTPTTPPPSQSYDQLGLVILGYSSTSGTPGTDLHGEFESIGSVTAPPDLLNNTAPDSCVMNNFSSPNITPVASLDAGAALLFHSGSSLYATAMRQVSGTSFSYDGTTNTAVPASLTVDIPGASGGFPAFTGVPVPLAGTFVLSASDGLNSVTPTSIFSWTNPSGNADLLVAFTVKQTTPAVTFSCIARDDGSFSVPSSFQSALTSAGFTSGKVTSAQRIGIHKTTSGSAVLETITSDRFNIP